MRNALNTIGWILLIGSGGAMLLTFNEWVKVGGQLTYTAVAIAVAALLLACGGMLLLAAAAILDQLYGIADLLQRPEEEPETNADLGAESPIEKN
jgi:hypothetical protein